MLKILIPFIILISVQIQAKSLRDANADAPLVEIVNTNVFTLTVDASTDGGLSSDFAHEVYVPLQTTTTANTNYYKTTTRANLPKVTSATAGNGTFRFYFEVDVDATAQKAHIAIKNSADDNYTIIASSGTISGDFASYGMTFTLTDVCGSGQFECTTLVEDQNPSIKKNTFLYVFLDDDTNAPTTVDPTANTSGIFYELKFSTKIYDSNTVTLNSLEKGDSQLIANFAGFGMEDFEGAYTILRTCTSSTSSGGTLGALGLSIDDASKVDNGQTSGQAKAKNLTNNTCYKVNVFLLDKYGFVSIVSNDLEETPELIQALLKSQSCFFFSAGFGRKHFVLDSLRSFRDDFLMKTIPGKLFTQAYYALAPKYAMEIYHSPVLSALFRGIGYTFHYFFHILSILVSVLLLRRIRYGRS